MRTLALTAVLGLSSLALAEEPELKPAQEEAKAKFDEAMEDPLKNLNTKCGTKVTVKTDFQNFKADAWTGMSFPSWCTAVVDGLASMCADRPAYKKVLAKKLTSVSCLFAGVKPKEKKDGSNEFTLRNMSFDKGVFTLAMDKDQANLDDCVKITLEKALN